MDLCVYINFHGPYAENMLNIKYQETDHPAAARAEHGDTIREETLQSQQPPFFFAMISANKQIQIPTLLISTLTVFYTQCALDVIFCNLTNTPTIQSMLLVWSQLIFAPHIQISANVLGMHTQLVDYEHILIVNTATTPSGKLVSTATKEHQLAYERHLCRASRIIQRN